MPRPLAANSFHLKSRLAIVLLGAFLGCSIEAAPLRFEIQFPPGLDNSTQTGRLFLILSRTNFPEPRLTLDSTGLDAPQTLARDIAGFGPRRTVVLDRTAFAFPLTKLATIAADDYWIQAVFDCNADLRLTDAPGNRFSQPSRVHVDPRRGGTFRVELTEEIAPERLPPDTDRLRFVKVPSGLLSKFFGRPIYLRAGIILPRDYGAHPERRYPVWVHIGGYGDRYTTVSTMMAADSEFRRIWLAEDTPRFILVQLDGAGPYGDPYYVNSANNGPYGDALVRELIPQVESQFHAIGQPHARVLSGTSTGGWVSLALQIFYPDFFNGAWSSCPDPVDFRAFELVDIYKDANAYLNEYGNERPSKRDLKGDVELNMRREVGVENLLGHGGRYTLSGSQWGAWNATFSPRAANGEPAPLWDPQTGRMDSQVAAYWRRYDLRLVLERDWKTLGPKLRGKLHIAAGEADQYFLNNAVHLLEESLAQASPPFEGKIVYGQGKGHGWMDLSLREMLEAMQTATLTKP